MKKELLKYCILYSGKEDRIDDNPLPKEQDEFKWFMWRVEWVICNRDYLNHNYSTEDEWEDFFKREIQNKIDTWADAWTGADPSPYYQRYFAYNN